MKKTIKKAGFKLISFMLIAAVALTCAPFGAVKATSENDLFAGGDGSEQAPYLISTAAQLDDMRLFCENNSEQYFKLINDIDLTAYLAEGGSGYQKWGEGGWQPCNINYSVFDGAGYSITGFWSNITDRTGLFLNIYENAKLKNLNLYTSELGIKGANSVGALAAICSGEISNCHVFASSMGFSNLGLENYIGGLVGQFSIGKISNSTFSGNINQTSDSSEVFAGGLVGAIKSDYTEIYGCNSQGTVAINRTTAGKDCFVGGLVGQLENRTTIFSSYSTSYVSGSVVGGLVGSLDASSKFSVALKDCYFAGTANADSLSFFNQVGGLVGEVNRGSIDTCYVSGVITGSSSIRKGALFGTANKLNTSFSNLYCNKETCGVNKAVSTDSLNTNLVRDCGKTTAAMKSQSTFSGFDFSWTWHIEEGLTYPRLRIGTCFAGGDGSEQYPYLIKTAAQLDDVRLFIGSYFENMHFKLVNDIDLTSYLAEGGAGYQKWGEKGWDSMSRGDSDFYSTFDGAGYAITGLWINSDASYGLFGTLQSAEIKNLSVSTSEAGIVGEEYAAVLAGSTSNSKITNCHVFGNVTGENHVGGLALRLNANTSISNCSSAVNVTATGDNACVGGLVESLNYYSSITNSYAVGDVTAKGAASKVGGIVGETNSSYSNSIQNCYAAGSVTAAQGSVVGAIGGFLAAETTVENIFFDKEATGQSHVAGNDENLCADAEKTTAEMIQKSTFNSFDFDNIWAIKDSKTYPYLTTGGNEIILTPTGSLSKAYDGTSDLPEIEYTLDKDVDLKGKLGLPLASAVGEYFFTRGSLEGPYQIMIDKSVKYVINKKELNVLGAAVASKEYDGTALAEITNLGVLSSGVVDGEDVALDTSLVTASFSDEKAGEQKEVVFQGYRLSGNDAGNYALTQPAYVTASIHDNEAPRGEIKIKNNLFKSFLNSITFNMFFKETVDVSITAQDDASGVSSIEYYLSAYQHELDSTDWNSLNWVVGSSFSMPNGANYVYARITDLAGNVTILNTNGVVVYTDSEQITQSISFDKNQPTDLTAEVELNGNTVNKIKNGDYTLTSADYSVSGNIITFKESFLESLDCGEYTLIVSYNPQGHIFVDEQGNEAPITTSIALNVHQSALEPAITAKQGSTCVINNYYIYGLKTRVTEGQLKSSYIDCDESVELEFTSASGGRYYGTGSTIKAKYPDGSVETYTIIIYGDVTGDGDITSEDVTTLNLSIAGIGEGLNTPQSKAANLDGSRKIDSDDINILKQAASGAIKINQADPTLS